MAKSELTKTIEAIKLNKRTMRPMTSDSHTVPYGAIIDQMKEDGDHMQFFYLGEPYESKADTVLHAIRRLD
jgi:hypothetical protein